MSVLILHSLPPDAVAAGRAPAEFDLRVAAESIAAVLPDAFVAGVRGEPHEILDVLSRHQPHVVFNLCEAPLGRADREAHCAAVLEWLDVPFTGSGSETLMLCRRKDLANAALAAAGVPTPRSDRFPCIIKPAAEDGSAGIHADSICSDADALASARERIAGPVVIQEFVGGREFAVSLWGPREPDWSSIGEVWYQNGLQLTTYAAKWEVKSRDFANSPMVYDTSIAADLREAILQSARAAWRALGVRAYGRVDVRLDANGAACVLDVNPNPDLSPGAGISRAVAEAGWTWERFVRAQIEWALSFARC
jgi:D-alanine-D-alanine ligase